MAKRIYKSYKERNEEMDKKMEKTVRRNWIICGASLLLIIVFYFLH